MGIPEREKWNCESENVERFVNRYQNDPKFAGEVDKHIQCVAQKLEQETYGNSAAKAFTSGRAAAGIITGIGPLAMIGDATQSVENGNTIVEAIIAGAAIGETR